MDIQTFIRKYDKDCDGVLSKLEYEKMLDFYGLESLKGKTERDFLFDTLDSSKCGKLSLEDFSTFLLGETVIDIVKKIEAIRGILRSKRLNLESVYREIDSSKDMKISFKEFQIFLKKCGLRMNLIEENEIFRFVNKHSEDFVSFEMFVDVFDPLNYFDPFTYNQLYFRVLSQKAQEYYKEHYNFEKGDTVERKNKEVPKLQIDSRE